MTIVSEENGVTTIQVNQRRSGPRLVLLDTDALHRLRPGILRLDDQGYRIRCVRKKVNGVRKTREILATRCLMGIDNDREHCVDHINRNVYDNRLCNLRVVTVAENNQNKGVNKRKHHVAGYEPKRGVTWDGYRWRATGTVGGVVSRLGSFRTQLEADAAISAWRAEHMPMSSDAAARMGRGY